MDFETFQSLCSQLISGKMSHLEFLEVLKQFGAAFEPEDEEMMQEKEKMMSMLEDIIGHARVMEREEKEDLADEVEAWLNKPEA